MVTFSSILPFVNVSVKYVKKKVDNFFDEIYIWKMLTPDDPRYYDPSFDDTGNFQPDFDDDEDDFEDEDDDEDEDEDDFEDEGDDDESTG